jgi:hypothetical protein
MPDRMSSGAVAEWLRAAITGPEFAGKPAVVWDDRGSQVLLHVGKLTVRTRDTALIVAIDTETEEFGVAPLIVRFLFGTARDPAPLVAATDDDVHGDPQVAARWGELFRDVVWAALVRLSAAHAEERGMRAQSMSIVGDHLRLAAKPPESLEMLAATHLGRQSTRRAAM